jgi:uncharacterized phage protein (TIGR01671 family)
MRVLILVIRFEMKRVIKFRAWHKAESKLCDIDVINMNRGAFLIGVEPTADYPTSDGKSMVMAPDNGRFCNFGEFELMQFTGLLDRNGREIFEGDVLKWKCSKSGSKKDKIHIVVIDWESSLNHGYSLTIYDKGEKWATGHSYWNANDREVIGNIYENPELL